MSKDKLNKIAKVAEAQMKFLEENKDIIKKQREESALNNKTCLTYWYPKIKSLKAVLTPKTLIFPMHFEDQLSLLDQKPTDSFKEVIKKIKEEGKSLGSPLFLKNSLFSGKHNWQHTCFIKDLEKLEDHVGSITDFAYTVGCEESMFLILREFIDTKSPFTAFGGMPVTKERRYFVEEGKVTFHHPYWPPESIREPSIENWQELLEKLNQEPEDEIKYLKKLTEIVGQTLGGSWSVDWLQGSNGQWYLIDMAEKHKSFIWKNYPLGLKGLDK